jgi:hypothetical protein
MIYIFDNMQTKYTKDVNIREYFKSIFGYINGPPKEIRQLFEQKCNNHCWFFATLGLKRQLVYLGAL